LFVRTGEENKIVGYLKEKLRKDTYLPFVLTKEAVFWDKGVPTLFRKILFPGYVIVQTECDADIVLEDIKCIIEFSDNWIYRVLSYSDNEKDIMMHESEQALWQSLVDSDFCITASIGVMEDEKIRITSGALKHKENCIKRLNRHKRKAIVEVGFAGKVVETTVVVEVKKVSNQCKTGGQP